MTANRFTILTITTKFKLPIETPDDVAIGVRNQLRQFADAYIAENAIDNSLMEYLSGTEENPNTEVGRALEVDVLTVETEVS